MLDFLNKVDTWLFLLINGLHSSFFDKIMWYISDTVIWIPLYAIVLFFVFKKLKIQGFITFVFLILLIVLTDQGSVLLFKNVFHRLRPCHQPEIANLVHIVNGKCGGQYGFISSHAANTFAFAVFISLFFKNRKFSVFIISWAAIVSYSRIYLGVHYPFDVFVGALFGIAVAFGLFKLHQFVFTKYAQKKPE